MRKKAFKGSCPRCQKYTDFMDVRQRHEGPVQPSAVCLQCGAFYQKSDLETSNKYNWPEWSAGESEWTQAKKQTGVQGLINPMTARRDIDPDVAPLIDAMDDEVLWT